MATLEHSLVFDGGVQPDEIITADARRQAQLLQAARCAAPAQLADVEHVHRWLHGSPFRGRNDATSMLSRSLLAGLQPPLFHGPSLQQALLPSINLTTVNTFLIRHSQASSPSKGEQPWVAWTEKSPW
jgi:hypothetical protein